MDYEADKIIVIQSVLMLSFRYADTEDRTGPWYWTGVAISLCHTLGLHCDPGATLSPFSNSQASLWRRLWWACVQREVLYSLAYGRPMRIHLDEFDVPKPSADDVWLRAADLPPDVRKGYLPKEVGPLACIYCTFTDLCLVLAKILQGHYTLKKIRSHVDRIKADEQELLELHERCRQYFEHSDPVVKSFAGHVWAHYEYADSCSYDSHLTI